MPVHPLTPARATFFAELCNPITQQAIEPQSCSNPLRLFSYNLLCCFEQAIYLYAIQQIHQRKATL